MSLRPRRRKSGPHPPATQPLAQRHAGRVLPLVLVAILLLAAALRLPGLTAAPPGLNQDEAANAWNAWCLLKTGKDQTGTPWPIFHTRALGANRSTLFIYTLLPFQALAGLSAWTNRLPGAVGGVFTVLLLYWIARRLFDRPTGLVAAALLTLSPWHIQLCRSGHEASIGPLLVCAALAALLWAGLPLADGAARPSAWRALIAGLVAGVCCYGYPAVRLFLPVLLTACFLVTIRRWWRLTKSRAGIMALLALLIGVGVTFGPLAYQHVVHPEEIAKRAESTWLWDAEDGLGTRAGKVAARYVSHFGADFLFLEGDHYELQSAKGFGVLAWYVLPLMLLGLIPMLGGLRRSAAARVLLCAVLLYPAGACLHRHMLFPAADGTRFMSLHALRTAPGLFALVLLAAVGALWAGRKLWQRQRTALLVTATVFTLGALALDARFIAYFFGRNTERPLVRRYLQADLVEACRWLRPRIDDYDAVFCTTTGMNQPWVVALVVVGYDPQQWFADPPEVRRPGRWDLYYRVGKLHFIYDDAIRTWLRELRENGRPDRVLFVVRPGQLQLRDPLHTIRDPHGEPVLMLYETTL